MPRILQDKKVPLILLPEAQREFYKKVSLPSALVVESKKVITALYEGMDLPLVESSLQQQQCTRVLISQRCTGLS